MRARARTRGAARRLTVGLGLLGLLAGCSSLPGGDGDERADAAPSAGATDVLETVEWGVLDDMVSVVVRNDGDRHLRRAAAVLTAVDERGTTLATSIAQAARSDCCTVLDLPPGSTYGLYFDIQVDAEEVADVEVRYRDVAWSPGRPEALPAVPASAVELRRGAEQTVVLADVTPTGPVAGAIVQATLVDGTGKLLGVVSGRWVCFAGGATHRIEIELPHPVPEGTTVSGVQVLPLRPPNGTALVEEPEPGIGVCDEGT